jgi:hypothetical protein
VTLGEAVAGQWLLPVPTFNEDLVARVVALPRLSWLAGGGRFEVVLKGEARVRYALESTQDWSGWVLEAEGVSSDDGELRWPVPASDVSRFLRAVVR